MPVVEEQEEGRTPFADSYVGVLVGNPVCKHGGEDEEGEKGVRSW